jgi:alkylhydroperoxidase family enzyme
VDENDIDALRAHGLDDSTISDAIQVVGYFNYVTRVADGVGIEDEPEWAGTRQTSDD